MRNALLTTTLAGFLALGAIALDAQTQQPTATTGKGVTATEVDTALESVYGVHPGMRRNHAKGTCALGTFTGKPDAAVYSRSLLFSGREMPVVARFSLGGGDPDASDAARGVRGMALEFRLPNGGLQHMTMIDAPMFFAAIPRTFLDNLLAARARSKNRQAQSRGSQSVRGQSS